MRTSWLAILPVLACIRRGPEAAPAPEDPGSGLRVEAIPEGLVVTRVLAGLAADRAGLVPGDLVAAVDGEPVGLGSARRLERGERALVLAVYGPLGGELRLVELKPVAGQPAGTAADLTPSVVTAFRTALREEGPGRVRRATEAMVAADFGGVRPAEAVGPRLRIARERRRAVLRGAVGALPPAAGRDPLLDLLLGEALVELGRPDEAVPLLEAAERGRQPDVLAGEVRGDLGGNAAGRARLARALARLGRTEEARAVAAALARTRPSGELVREFSLAEPPPPEQWWARLPPAPPLELALLDGTRWSLLDHRGQVVLLSFWATWCAPCKEELPQLDALRRARGGRPRGAGRQRRRAGRGRGGAPHGGAAGHLAPGGPQPQGQRRLRRHGAAGRAPGRSRRLVALPGAGVLGAQPGAPRAGSGPCARRGRRGWRRPGSAGRASPGLAARLLAAGGDGWGGRRGGPRRRRDRWRRAGRARLRRRGARRARAGRRERAGRLARRTSGGRRGGGGR